MAQPLTENSKAFWPTKPATILAAVRMRPELVDPVLQVATRVQLEGLLALLGQPVPDAAPVGVHRLNPLAARRRLLAALVREALALAPAER